MPRSRTQIWTRNIILGAVIVGLGFCYAMPQSQSFEGSVAEVNGESISRDVFEVFRELNRQAAAASDPDAPDAAEVLDSSTRNQLIKVMKEPKNAILRQYKRLFELENAKLDFTEDGLEEIATKAIEKKTGARALRQMVELFMLDIMFELPNRKDAREFIINARQMRGEEPIVPRTLKSIKKESASESKKETA